MTTTGKTILIAIPSATALLIAGITTGIIIQFTVGFTNSINTNTFNIEKEGGFIYSVKDEAFCVKNDFQMKRAYKKEYESDPITRFTYSFDANENSSQIKDNSGKDMKDTSLLALKDMLDKKSNDFDQSQILKVKDLYFLDVKVEAEDADALYYYNGSDIKFITCTYDSNGPISKIKIMENFIK